MATTIISFTGPSGSGKTVLLDSLLRAYPDHTAKWTQFTTRPRRPGENAEQYVFLKPNQYHAIKDQLTCRTNFGGNHYGTMPEASTEGKAVLTIADVTGLRDLISDVASHNRALADGEPEGKFGGEPARLVKVFFDYAITEESVGARGRSARGVESVTAEAYRVMGLRDELREAGDPVDVTVVTTNGSWPDPAEFFDEHVWPALTAPDVPPERRAREILRMAEEALVYAAPEWCGRLADAVEGLLFELGTGMKLAPAGPPAAEAADDLDAALLGGTPAPAALPAAAAPQEADPEPPAAEEAAAAPQEADPEPPAAGPEPEPAAPRGGGGSPPPEPAPEGEPPPPPRFRTMGQLVGDVNFEDWLLRGNIAQAAFKDRVSFEGAFGRYMTEHGLVLPDAISYSDTTRRDAKGGLVKVFAVLSGKERYTMEWNDRLKRVIGQGMQE